MLRQMRHEVTVNVLALHRSGDGCVERLDSSLK